MFDHNQRQAPRQSTRTNPGAGPEGISTSPYFHGVLLPVSVQVPAIMLWSLMPTAEWLAGETSLRGAIREAALTLWGSPWVIIALGLGVVSVPFAVVQVLCARALGRSGASCKMLFFVGLLNPCTAWLLIMIGLRALF